MQPPDLVGQGGDQLRFVRGEQNRGPIAAETFQTESGPSADEGVAAGQSMVEREGGDRREIERIGWTLVACRGGGLDLARIRPIETGGEPEEFALAVAVFSDDGNDRAVGGGGGKLVERREGGFAELNGHLV